MVQIVAVLKDIKEMDMWAVFQVSQFQNIFLTT